MKAKAVAELKKYTDVWIEVVRMCGVQATILPVICGWGKPPNFKSYSEKIEVKA